VREALIEQKGYRAEDLPAERTLRDILNRMNYRLKRIQKGQSLRKTEETDAVFANIAAVKPYNSGLVGIMECEASFG